MSSIDPHVTSMSPPRGQAVPAEEEARRRQLTLDALADVDAGNGLPHADVKAWAGRLPASR
ncbi:MAG: hypothetical protein ACOY4U_01605 [Pseudomonadota bacterium]